MTHKIYFDVQMKNLIYSFFRSKMDIKHSMQRKLQIWSDLRIDDHHSHYSNYYYQKIKQFTHNTDMNKNKTQQI